MIKGPKIQAFLDKFAKAYGHDAGKMLIHTGVIGWVLSSLAQTLAIVTNKKLSVKEKLFLVPQELADGIINIASFYIVTQTIKSMGSKIVKSGKLLPKDVREFLKTSSIAEKIGKSGTNIFKEKVLPPDLAERLSKFDNGVGVIATTVGSVLSCNLITPILRNEVASYRQKKTLQRVNSRPYHTSSNLKV